MSQAVLGALTAEDVGAISETSHRFAELVIAGDFDAASQLYASNAVVMPPHHPACRGRAAAREWLSTLPRITRFDVNIEVVDGRADLAYVRGTYSATLETPDGALNQVGKFLEIRRRQPDGSWPIEADIFNSDLP